MTCGEKSGFLFPHACPLPAAGACQRCNKPVCASHWHRAPQGALCTACAKQAGFTAGDSPYFQAGALFGPGFWAATRHDADDFTAADGASTAAAFELDVTAS